MPRTSKPKEPKKLAADAEDMITPDEPMPKPKAVRKAPTKRLSRSSGMGDIATPETLGVSMESDLEITRLENISIASRAVHAANIHGSRMQQSYVPESVSQPMNDDEYELQQAESEDMPTDTFVAADDSVSVDAPVDASEDTSDFLAPEYRSFDLDKKNARSGVATFFIWLLDIVIVLGIVVLFLLYKYPTQTQNWIAKVFPKYASLQTTAPSTADSSASSASATQLTFRTASSVTALAQAVDSSAQSSFSTFSVQSSTDPSEVSSLNLNADTVLYKSADQSEAQQVVTFLTQQFGLQPKLQENDSQQEDLLVFLPSTVANPSLANDTAAVFNASGKTGAAKTYCTTLTSYKAASCSAANSATPSKGLQVSYKTQAQYFTLARTSAFSQATFTAAPSTQTSDIVVTIGS